MICPVRSVYASLVATASLALSCSLLGCGAETKVSSEASATAMTGKVFGGQQPVTGSTIQLYSVGTTGDGSAATPLLTTTVTTSDGSGLMNSNANAGNNYNQLPAGSFYFDNSLCVPSSAQVYLTSTGGNPGLTAGTNNTAIAEMAALGSCANVQASNYVIVDELTTVGSIAPLAQYMNSYSHLGSGSADVTGFDEALAEVNEYTNFTTGTVPGPGLPSGYYASTAEITALGDVIAACVNSTGGVAGDGSACGKLFTLTTPPVSGATAPTDTIGAMVNIVKYPNNNVAAIFGLIPSPPVFPGAVTTPPSSWNLPIIPIAATPSITPATGSYAGTQTVKITDATAGATIYYTTDGTTPTTSSTMYSGSFDISGNTLIQAIATASGYAASPVASSSIAITSTGTPTKLAFLVQPSNTAIGFTMNPVVQVAVEDMNGNIVSNATGAVTIGLGANPGGATLSGTLTNTPTNGIASFSNLSLNVIANGYTLVATDSPLTSATSGTFAITPYPIAVNLSGPLVGVGSTLPGTFTLSEAAPAGGLTVNLATSDSTIATISPAAVVVGAGGNTGSFTYLGVALGTATLSASATGYLAGSANVTATSSLISMGQIPTVSLGTSTSIPLNLGVVAPAGGLTVSFASSNTSVVTVTPSVFIPAGQKIPAENPQVTGVGFGSATITASAPNFAPDVRDVSVSLTASFPATASIPLTTPTGVTLTISQPAPSGGLTFTLASSNTSVATVPSSITIPVGSSTASIPVTGIAAGTTNITASYPGVTPATVAVIVSGTINVSSLTMGAGTYESATATLGNTPPSPVAVTITSSDPTHLLLSTSPTTVGSSSITFPTVSGSTPTFYVQGIATGTATYSVSATGYTTTNGTVTLYPTGFVLASAGQTNTTTTFSGTSTYSILVAVLNPSTLATVGTCTYNYGCYLNPGSGPFSLTLTSSNTGVATVSSPISIGTGVNSQTFTITPIGAGTTTITLGSQPNGFSASTTANSFTQTETVTAPAINASALTLGAGTYVATSAGLQQTPPSPVTVTIALSDPTVAVLSANSGVLGSGGTLTLPNVSSSTPTFYVQALKAGTVTATISAPGFATQTETYTVYPSGFVLASAGSTNTTTTFSSTSSYSVLLALLNPTTLATLGTCTYNYGCYVNPGTGPFSLTLTSSTTTVATVSSPISFAAGSNIQSFTITPVGAGSTTITLGSQPTGFSTSTSTNAFTQTETVTAPGMNVSSLTLGVGTYEAANAGLQQTPPSPVTVTVTLSDPTVAVLSTSASMLGTGGTLTFNNISGTTPNFYIDGLKVGTTTATFSAPGFANATVTYTVYPTGFVLASSGSTNTTTTFSTPSNYSILVALLNPTTFATVGTCTYNYGCYLSPGAGPFSLNLTSSNTNVVTVSSPITITSGANIQNFTLTPVGAGTATITLGAQPAGFTASSTTNAFTQTETVTAPGINVSSQTLGVGTYVGASASLQQTPPSPVTVTVTISDPTVAILSTGTSSVGTGATLSFQNVTGATPAFYVQGLKVGTTTFTVSAPGYSNATATYTVYPTGFVLASSGSTNTTTTFSAASNYSVLLALLNPTTLTTVGTCTYNYGCYLSPGTGPFSLTLTSSKTSVATVSSPVTFTSGTNIENFAITPAGAGNTTITLGSQPAGFVASTTQNAFTQTETVTAPGINGSSLTLGAGTYEGSSASLQQTPPSPVVVTVTVSDPTIAVLSTSSTVLGTSGMLTFTNISGSIPTFYVQALKAGTTTATISAPGFANTTVTYTVDPVSFVLASSGSTNTTTSFSSPSTYSVLLALLNPTTLQTAGSCTYNYGCYLNPGSGPFTLNLTSSVTTVATVTSSVTFAAGSNIQNFTITPVGAGTTTITLGSQPASFTPSVTANAFTQTETVTAPGINISSPTLGVGLYTGASASLQQTPPSPVTVTVTVGDPTIAVISTNSGVIGSSGTLSFSSISGAVPAFYVQGLKAGSTTITVSAPGFANSTATLTVDPTSFVLASAGSTNTTTSFSSPSTYSVFVSLLNPTTLQTLGSCTYNYGCALLPGTGPFSLNLTSSNTAVATVSTPVTFTAGTNSASFTITPVGAGSTTITLGAQPAGFTVSDTPNANTQTETVTAPGINTVGSAVVTGYDLEVPQQFSLSQAPPSATTITVTSSNPAIAVVSNSATAVGGASAMFTGITTTGTNSVYIQGLVQGTTSITISAPGYSSTTLPVTVGPSGFVIQIGNFTTTTNTPNTLIPMFPAVLSSSLAYITSAQINPQSPNLSLPLTSSNTAAGIILSSPLTFTPGSTVETFTFQPVAAGSTNLSIGSQPSGFSVPTTLQQVTATVSH